MAVSADIQIGGNVEGSIVVGNNNFVVNTNHGTIVYKQAAPQVRLRQFSPKPPRSPRGFINRSDELAKLENWIAGNEIVLVHAPDGMGKTALLKQVANSKAALAMTNGVILLESVDVDGQALGPNDIIQRLFDALFESVPPLKVDATSARTYLSNTGPLILVDEVPLSTTLLRALPDFFPQGAIIITADLPFSGEYQRLAIGPLPRKEAILLLANKAEIQTVDETQKTLDLLCAWLGDISLAIVICANLIRELKIPPETVLQEIEQFTASHADSGSELDRIFAFAFSKLRPEEQRILSTAALTPGVSMTPEWLSTALGGVSGAPFLERLKALGLLFENSPRLRLPPGFQASARRAAVVDEDTVLSRLANYLVVDAEKNLRNWEFFDDELGNLTGTLAWAIRAKNWNIVMRLVRALDPYLSLHGYWDSWSDALDTMLSAAQQTGNQAAEAWSLHQLGTRAIGAGDRQQALDFLRRALDIRQRLGDAVGMAYTQHNIDILLGPPSGPRSDEPKPQSPKPAGNGVNPLLVVGGLGLLGIVLLAVLIGAIFLLRPSTPITQTPFTPLPLSTLTPETITPTSTPQPIVPIQPPTDTLTPTPTATSVPTPMGGGSGRIAFVSDTAGNPDLYLMDVIDQKPTALTSSGAAEDNPAWSPNGSQIAFDSSSDGRAILVLNIYESSDANAITDYLEYSYPAWSPDGKKIAFVSVSDGNADIYVMNTDGSGQTRLTDDAAWDADPTWSPDSKQIAFVSNRDGGNGFQIYVMNANGSKQTRLPNNRPIGTWNSFPNWSHDGSRIVFQSQDNSDSPFQIYVMSARGRDKPIRLTSEGNNEFAEWSPDGKLIAFSSDRDGNNEIYMMNADGSAQVNVTNSRANDSNPSWQPGGGN